MEPFLTPEEVCELLKVKRAWVYDQVERNGFPCHRLGSRMLRFRASEIERWIDGSGHGDS